jgi:hypothetical protein
MPIVSVEQIRTRLSSPSWTPAQQQAVAAVIAQREGELAAWLRVPITPVRRTEAVPVLGSGLVATTAPVYRLHAVDGIAVTGDAAPAGYEWRDTNSGTGRYLARPRNVAFPMPYFGYSNRAFDPLYGPYVTVAVDYDAGWGPDPLLAGAIAERVEAYAVNRHDDTVVARNLDAEAPPPQRENWIESDFVALRAYRQPGVGYSC